MRAALPVLWLLLVLSGASNAKILSFFAQNSVAKVATSTISFHNQLKGLSDSQAVLSLSLYGFGRRASALFEQLLEGFVAQSQQPLLVSLSRFSNPLIVVKEELSRDSGGFSGLPTQAAVCVVTEHDVKERSRLLAFARYFVENCARLPGDHTGRLVIGVLDSGSGEATNEAKQLLQESIHGSPQVDVRILQLSDRDLAASTQQLHTALQGISPMRVSDARSLRVRHEVVAPIERSSSSECGEAASEALATFQEKMDALSDALQGSLMLDFGEILGALMDQALATFDDSTTAFKDTAARSTVRSILTREMSTLAHPMYAKQLELVRTVAIDEFRKAVQDIRVGPSLVSDIEQAIKAAFAVFDRHAKQIRPQKGDRQRWNPNFERAELGRTLADYRQTAADTARAQGLPDRVMSRKPVSFTFHWLIDRLPIVDFRQQIVGLYERPILENKEDAIPPNKLTYYERLKMIRRRAEKHPIVANLKRGLLGGYMGGVFEPPNSDIQFLAQRYHEIQGQVGDRYVEDDPTEVEFSKETIGDAQNYMDYARPNYFWHQVKKGIWERSHEIEDAANKNSRKTTSQ